MTAKNLICIPTYNELENVQLIIKEISGLNLINTDLLFIDDNSPDGTGQKLENLKKNHDNIFIIHRSGKLGIGNAHLTGIEWAYDHHYDYLITMDCDFTHPPQYLPKFIQQQNNYHVLIGSRYLNNNSLTDWSIYRKILTKIGHLLTKYLLKIPQDATSAFRCYDLTKIPRDIWSSIASQSYSFFFESLFVLTRNGYPIKEISIHLPARTIGHSKMKIKDIIISLKLIIVLSYRCIIKK